MFDKQENSISNFLDNNHFSLIEGLSFDIAETYNKISNEEKSQLYYKKEIDNILSYCNCSIKDMSLTMFLTKAIKISINNSKDTYKLKQLKQLQSDVSNNISSNLQPMPYDEELEKHMTTYYNHIRKEYKSIYKIEERIDYLFLNFIHFGFIKSDIEKNCKKEEKNSFPMRLLATKINTSHYGRVSIEESCDFTQNQTLNFLYKEHYSRFVPITNQILFNLDFDDNWTILSKKIINNYINKISMIEIDFKSQALQAFEAYLNKEYTIFLHLSFPIIEHILRNYLSYIGGDLLSVKNITTTQHKTLNELLLLIKENENNYIEKGMIDYFIYILVDGDALNLRNVILHGFMPSNGFNKWNSMYVLSIFLYLICYFHNDES